MNSAIHRHFIFSIFTHIRVDVCCVPLDTIHQQLEEIAMSEYDILQNQEDYHDENQNDKDSGTHNHAPFLLRSLSLQNTTD
jgi:hypothetical protein